MSVIKRSYQGQSVNAEIRGGEGPSKRRKSSHAAFPDKLTAKLTNGLADKEASRVDETKAVVSTGVHGDVSDVEESEQSEEDDEEDSSDEGAITSDNGVKDVIETNGHSEAGAADEDVDMADEQSDTEEPSFGDLLKARHPDIIDISAQLTGVEQSRSLVPATSQLVTGNSLATVLQQALKTKDKDLLESCFQLRDVQAIKNTIQRLPSPLIDQLLSRVSERMYRRPGRAGGLMVWIQWSLVAHGGYLASQPEIMHKLKALNQVIKQRAQGLQPLLQLKGKLDMLSAQLELRRDTQRSTEEVVDDERAVAYIEGKTRDWGDESDKAQDDEVEDDFEPGQQDDSDAEGSQEQNAGVFDVEAEESQDEDSQIDEDSDMDDESEAESASDLDGEDLDVSDDEEVPPPRSRRR